MSSLVVSGRRRRLRPRALAVAVFAAAALIGALVGWELAPQTAHAGGPCYSNAHYSQTLSACNSLGSRQVRNCTPNLRQDHNTYNPTTTPHGSAAPLTVFSTYKFATGESVTASSCPGAPTTNG